MKRFIVLAIALLFGSTLADGQVRLENGMTVIQGSQRTYYTGLKHKPAELRGLGESLTTLADCTNLPAEFDLRDYDVVPPIRDQGQCGSCWSFSVTASLESAEANRTGKLLDLSEQELVSCDKKSYGCNGGWLNGFGYQIERGQTQEFNFPYTASDAACPGTLSVAAKGVNYAYVGTARKPATVQQVQCALFKSRTIPWITVSADDDWSSASRWSDVVHKKCTNGQTNHAVGIIGWKTVAGKVYFKVRNSWGNKWGSNAGRTGAERGYLMAELGCDNLGEEVAYIISEKMDCQPPKAKLPMEVLIGRGDEVLVGVKAEDGVTYSWGHGASGATTSVSPTTDTIFNVTAKNSCGTTQTSTRVRVK